MIPIVVSPAACYATKPNIAHPGTAAQVTAANTQAQTDINSMLASQGVNGVSVTVTGAIERAL